PALPCPPAPPPFPTRRSSDLGPVGAGPRPARGRTLCAPTAENGPRALVRRRQAQKRKRTSYNFLPAQAPSGAGWDRARALLILRDRKSTRLNSSHVSISYAVF